MDITKTLICTDYDGTLSFERIPKENPSTQKTAQ